MLGTTQQGYAPPLLMDHGGLGVELESREAEILRTETARGVRTFCCDNLAVVFNETSVSLDFKACSGIARVTSYQHGDVSIYLPPIMDTSFLLRIVNFDGNELNPVFSQSPPPPSPHNSEALQQAGAILMSAMHTMTSTPELFRPVKIPM